MKFIRRFSLVACAAAIFVLAAGPIVSFALGALSAERAASSDADVSAAANDDDSIALHAAAGMTPQVAVIEKRVSLSGVEHRTGGQIAAHALPCALRFALPAEEWRLWDCAWSASFHSSVQSLYCIWRK